MDVIKCPKCQEDVTINIGESISEDGEVFRCPKCGYKFRYVKE
jgi:DNA-directed RNA polymerase subunit RPC12/RpoP